MDLKLIGFNCRNKPSVGMRREVVLACSWKLTKEETVGYLRMTQYLVLTKLERTVSR